MIDETNNSTSSPNFSNEDRIGFCQNCGKPLNRDTIRVVGTGVYCEPCLEARLAGTVPPYGAATPGSAPGASTTHGYTPVDPGIPVAGFPAQILTGRPNPSLAALLGLIPGVGAMYNEQYAKGVIHLAIFAILVTLSNTAGIFGLFVFGWVCYMAIEAHHTARARRDGTLLPNPFGFNDLGDRMGFGKSWPNAANPGPVPPAPGSPYAASAAATDAASAPIWGAPTDQYAYTPPAAAPYTAPTQPNYGQAPGYSPGYTQTPGYPPTATPYTATYAIPEIPVLPPRSRFPAGAIWLIALGTLFLVGNTDMFHDVSASALGGLALIGFSVWIFLRKMTSTGQSLQDDGSPLYTVRVLRALRGAVWILLIGVLLLLTSFHLIRWDRTWPYFIILAGLMTILERTLYNSAAANAFQYPPAPYPQHPPVPPTDSDRINLNQDLNQEGR